MEEEKEQQEQEKTSVLSTIAIRLFVTTIFLIIAGLLFEFGGWGICWGKEFSLVERMAINYASAHSRSVKTTETQSFILTKDCVLIRINEKFYGIGKNNRHFDAPVIQWIMLIASLSFMCGGIKNLLTGSLGNDD